MPRRPPILAVLGCCLALAACAQADQPTSEQSADPSPSPSTQDASVPPSSATSTPSSSKTPLTKRELVRAVNALREDRDLDFDAAVYLEGNLYHSLYGTFRRKPLEWATTSTLPDPEDPDKEVTMHVQASRGRMWMQMSSWSGDQAGCWLEMPEGMAPLGMDALRHEEPRYVTFLLGLLEGRHLVSRAAGEKATVRVPLGRAASLLPTRVQDGLDLDEGQASRIFVPVKVEVGYGRVQRVLIKGWKMAEALPPSTRRDNEALSYLRAVGIQLGWNSGSTMEIKRPPTSTRVAYADAGTGCDANRQ